MDKAEHIKKTVKEASKKPPKTAFNPVLRERDMGKQAAEDGCKQIEPFISHE